MIYNQELAQAEPGSPISCNQVESILANTQLVPQKLYFVEILPLKFSFTTSVNILTPPMNSVEIYWPYIWKE